MVYTGREQLTILRLKDGEENICIEELLVLLSKQPSNMVYCEKDEKLVGVISTGDICRAYNEHQSQVKINRKFTCIHCGEYMDAKKIFKKKKSINALPIITEDGILVGDYTRWDDLLILEYSIETNIKYIINTYKKNLILVRPCDISTDRWRIFQRFSQGLKVYDVAVSYIDHLAVPDFINDDNIILFVDQNEVRACITRLKILLGDRYKGHNNLKTYKEVFYRELNFSDDECADYLRKLQNKGIRILGLIFEESKYYRNLIQRIEERFKVAGERVCNVLPKVMYEAFFDDLYSEEYAESILNRSIDYENNGGVCSLRDCKSQYYNVSNGERITTGHSDKNIRSIYFYGACYIYGHYVEDKNTIESFLQLNINRYGEVAKVVNCGSLKTDHEYRYLPRIICTQLRKGDILVIDRPPRNIKGVCYLDLTKVLEENDIKIEWIIDQPWHCNHKVNKIYADAIYNALKPFLYEGIIKKGEVIDKDQDFIKFLYLDKYFKNIDLSPYKEIGSVVMNCNPFTCGHRYLIEEALKVVDFLIIFVVEQDKSVFSFAERFAMVQKGIEDLSHVMVVPSGPFILSQLTVPEYFNNKQMTENVGEHEEQDVAIFAERIAPPLGIRYRFVGEEPMDEVTNQYNNAMKKVLPKHGIKIIVIPRKSVNEQIVSASMVRRCLEEKIPYSMDKLLPETTRKILGLII